MAPAIALFCMPVSLPVTPASMNYASVVFAGFASISVLWYFIHGRKSFSGPPVQSDMPPEEVGVMAGRTVTGEEDSPVMGSKEKQMAMEYEGLPQKNI